MRTLEMLIAVVLVIALIMVLSIVIMNIGEKGEDIIPDDYYCKKLDITLKDFNENLNAKTGQDKINYYKYYAECFDAEDVDADKEFICKIGLDEDMGYCG